LGRPLRRHVLGRRVGSFSDRKNAAASGTALGAATGTLVGYNWQNGAIVYGLEGDIGANYLNRKFDATPGLPAREAESIYSADARARAGYEMGRFLPFVAVGLTFVRNDQFQRAPFDFDGQTTRAANSFRLGAAYFSTDAEAIERQPFASSAFAQRDA
jgi:hypothetical protein